MDAVALTLLLAAGFVFVKLWQVTRILSLKEGYAIYLSSVIAAVPLFVLSYKLVAWCGQGVATEVLGGLLTAARSLVGSERDLRFLTLAFVSLPLAVGAAALLNMPVRHNPVLQRYLYERLGDEEPLDLVISEALERELPILVTLSTGKIYLGYSLSSELYGRSGSQWLRLAPWLSGYRQIDHRLVFTTLYEPVAWREQAQRLVHDERFQIAIPLSTVSSVTPFDMVLYSQYFAGEHAHGEQTGDTSLSEVNTPAGWQWRASARTDLVFYIIGLFAMLVFSLAMEGAFAMHFVSFVAAVALLLRAGFPAMRERKGNDADTEGAAG